MLQPHKTTSIFIEKYLCKNKIFFLAITLVFLLFFLIGMETPFHSDDFSYVQLSSLHDHVNHYLRWSGRLVADFFSSTLLYFPRFLSSAFLAVLATALCWLITVIPDTLLKRATSPWKFLLITSLYWVCNPNLGQTNFWVVGSCNYLVTTFFVALSIYLTIRFEFYRPSWGLALSAVIAFLAGCSNENTTIALIYSIIALTVWEYYRKINFSRRYRLLIFSCILIGAAVLILAPGNFSRLSDPSFNNWRSLSLIDQVTEHLSRSRKYFRFFSLPLLLLVLNWSLIKRNDVTEESKLRLVGSLIFFSASLIALAVMVKSPTMPSRSYTGMFFFLLLSLSFVAEFRSFNQFWESFQKLITVILTLFMLVSFTFMLVNYKSTKIQEQLRNAHINYEKLLYGNNASPTIPGYYFTDLLRNKEKFDMFHSPSQGSYFGVKKVNLQNANFDYSVIVTGKQIKVVNHSGLENVKIYTKPGFASLRKSTIVLECKGRSELKNVILKFYRDRDKEPVSVLLSQPIELMGNTYFGTTQHIDHADQIQSVIVEKPA